MEHILQLSKRQKIVPCQFLQRGLRNLAGAGVSSRPLDPEEKVGMLGGVSTRNSIDRVQETSRNASESFFKQLKELAIVELSDEDAPFPGSCLNQTASHLQLL